MEVNRPFIWNQTNWLQGGLREKIQIRWLTWQAKREACRKRLCTEGRNWLWRNIFSYSKMGYHPNLTLFSCSERVESSSNGCEDCFLEWRLERECLHVYARRLCCEMKRTKGMQSCQILVWPKTSTSHMVSKVNRASFEVKFRTFWSWWCNTFIKKVGRSVVYLVVYVDDLLMTGNNEDYIASIKKDLSKCFEMTDFLYYLGIEVTQHPNYMFIS